MTEFKKTAGETANNRLCSQDEKEQINALNESCINLSKEFNLELDLEDYRKVSHGNESKYLKKNGVLQESKMEKRDPFEDSRTLDWVGYFKGKDGNYLNVYAFMKYTTNSGGLQDMIGFEVGRTRDNAEKDADKHNVYLFMLEGSYWDSVNETRYSLKDKFDNEKTFYVNRDNVEEVLISIFKKHNLI